MLPLPAGLALALDPFPVEFAHCVFEAMYRRSAAVDDTEPVVISSLVMKESNPIKIVDTSQAGLKVLGWKSDIERHSRVEGWKRPDGVCIRIAGGANG